MTIASDLAGETEPVDRPRVDMTAQPNQPGPLPDFLTVMEAASILRIGRTRAYASAAQYEATDGADGLPVVRLGRQLRVPRARLEALVGHQLEAWPPPATVVNATTPSPIEAAAPEPSRTLRIVSSSTGTGGSRIRRPHVRHAAMGVAAAAVVAALLSSCSSDDEEAAAQPTTTVVDTAATEPLPSPSTNEFNECRDTPYFEDDQDPDAVARLAHEAWELGDEQCADYLMTDAALRELFAVDGKDNPYEFTLCRDSNVGAVDQQCGFFTVGAELRFLMDYSDDRGWQVVDVEFLDA